MSKEKYASEKQERHSIDPAFFDGPQQEKFRLSRFIYNSREGTVLGRNTESWGKAIRSWSIIFKIRLFELQCSTI